MMNQKPRLSGWGRALLLLPCLMAAAVPPAAAQRIGAVQPKFVAGEIVLYMQPGVPEATADAVAAKVNAVTVTPLQFKDCYKVVLPVNAQTDQDATNAVTVLKQDPNVRWVGRNSIKRPHANTTEPNDPHYTSGEQWGPKQINMPLAWTLMKGSANSNVADVDTGFFPTHEDLTTTYLFPGSFDISDNDSDITADGNGPTGEFDHGTSTSSIIAAHTNNKLGMAGIIWQAGKVVGLKAVGKGKPIGFTFTDLLNSYAYIAANQAKYHITVLNLSLGGPGDPNDASSPEYVALKGLVDSGIIVVASSGNGYGSDLQQTPGGFAFCVTVSSTDKEGKVTNYSDKGKVDLAAPGGNSGDSGNPAEGVTVALNTTTSTYALEDGTSFAAPHVSGVAGLLMGVPNVTAARATKILKDTANHNGLSVLPDPGYGYGIVDAYAALLRVSVSAIIELPEGIDPINPGNGGNGNLQPAPVETLKPMMRFSVNNVPTGSVSFVIDPGTNQITFTLAQLIAGTVPNVTDFAITGDTTSANPQYEISFRYTFKNAVPFSHTIQITAVNSATGISATDTRSFNIAPHVLPQDVSGVTFISIPYYETAVDQASAAQNGRGAILDSSVTLYRWMNSLFQDPKTGQTGILGSYATFGSGSNDINASLTPLTYVPTIDGAPSNEAPPSPVGVAYFLKSNGPIPYVTYGRSITDSAIRIPLHEGWNMVGDPFPFNVGFNSILVEKPSGERLAIQTAVDRKMLLPHIYHYAAGEYTFETLPDGNLLAWQGQWIYVMPRDGGNTLKDGIAIYLIVPPAGVAGTSGRAATSPRLASTRAASTTVTSTAPRVSGTGSWAIRLEANARNLKDSYNYIGMSTRATEGDDFTKVPKPPKPSPYLSLGMTRSNSALGLLSQDLQPVGGERAWNVSVSTDQPNTDITLSWPDIKTLPRNYHLTLTDTVTGQSVDLRNTSVYQFNSGHSAGSRSFTLKASPTTGGRAVLTNIFVNPSRPSGSREVASYEIGYTVSQDVRIEATILGFNGHVVSNLGLTRAATSGNNKIVWNGLDNAGHAIPAGQYLLQMRAITTDGAVTRQVVPLVITGR